MKKPYSASREERVAKRPRAVGVELIQDVSILSSPVDGFLRRHRLRMKTMLEDDTRSDVYVVDFTDRAPSQRDASAILAFSTAPAGEPAGAARVLLRRQLRYPAFAVTGAPLFTEAVAGIIERPESPHDAAVRELFEETGLRVPPDRVRQLGRCFFASPGCSTERIYPFVAEVDDDSLDRAEAMSEGGMEDGAELLVTTLSNAMVLADNDADSGLFIADAKTEILLHRLNALLVGW